MDAGDVRCAEMVGKPIERRGEAGKVTS